MSDFADAVLIFAGDSSNNTRDYIVRAGTSILENRDYIVVFAKRFKHQTSVIQINSSETRLTYFSKLVAATATVWITSEAASIGPISLGIKAETGIIDVTSQTLNLVRKVAFANSVIRVESAIAGLLRNQDFTLQTFPIGVESSNANLQSFVAYSLNGETCALSIDSGDLTVDATNKLGTCVLSVGGGNLTTTYGRILHLESLSLGVSSNTGKLNRFTAYKLQAANCALIIDAGSLTTTIRRFVSLQNHTVGVNSTNTSLVYNRIFRLQTHPLEIRSGNANLFFNSLAALPLGVSSSQTTFALQRRATLESSVVEVRSSTAEFKNPYLVALSYTIRTLSGLADLRFLPTGYLPSTAPTTRTFQPPSYKIEKTPVFSGRTVRQIMCSKPSEALLTLEYLNVSDAFAEEVFTAYDESYGTRYGFKLPPEIVTGASPDLLNYIHLNNSTLKWYFAEKPSVEAVSKGLCNLNVQLKAKVEAL